MSDFIKQNTKALVMHKTTNYILMAFIFAAALSYIYFANITVRALTVLEKTEQQKQSLSVKVSEMEAKRLAFDNNVNKEKAIQMGFVEVVNPVYIIRDSNKASLSLKTD